MDRNRPAPFRLHNFGTWAVRFKRPIRRNERPDRSIFVRSGRQGHQPKEWDMKRILVSAMALALALAALLPGISAAKLASNHNRTAIR